MPEFQQFCYSNIFSRTYVSNITVRSWVIITYPHAGKDMFIYKTMQTICSAINYFSCNEVLETYIKREHIIVVVLYMQHFPSSSDIVVDGIIIQL